MEKRLFPLWRLVSREHTKGNEISLFQFFKGTLKLTAVQWRLVRGAAPMAGTSDSASAYGLSTWRDTA